MRKTREEVPENLSLSEDLFNRDNNEKPKQSLGGLSPVQFREHNPKGTYLIGHKRLTEIRVFAIIKTCNCFETEETLLSLKRLSKKNMLYYS